MEARQKKRVVAAVTAVYKYLKSHEEQQVALAAGLQSTPPFAVGAVSLWSSSGRQATMEMRRLLQMRLTR
jgi:hypothetical protein